MYKLEEDGGDFKLTGKDNKNNTGDWWRLPVLHTANSPLKLIKNGYNGRVST